MDNLNNSKAIQESQTYERPFIKTYTANELLDLIGPVQAGSNVSPDDNLLDPDNPGGFGYYAPEDDAGIRVV